MKCLFFVHQHTGSFLMCVNYPERQQFYLICSPDWHIPATSTLTTILQGKSDVCLFMLHFTLHLPEYSMWLVNIFLVLSASFIHAAVYSLNHKLSKFSERLQAKWGFIGLISSEGAGSKNNLITEMILRSKRNTEKSISTQYKILILDSCPFC